MPSLNDIPSFSKATASAKGSLSATPGNNNALPSPVVTPAAKQPTGLAALFNSAKTTFNNTIGERLGAVGRSLKTGSVQPLVQSFQKQGAELKDAYANPNPVVSGMNAAFAFSGDATPGDSIETLVKPPAEISLPSAIKDATPAYSKNLAGESAIKDAEGNIIGPRVNEGGKLTGRTVNPTPTEIEAGHALATVPNYPADGTNLQKFQSIEPEIAKRGEALSTSLQGENILRPPQVIAGVVQKALDNVSENSVLLQKSDPVIKNYMRVVDAAIGQNDGTLAGELNVRKMLDATYENARGKLAFGSDRLSALDEVHRAARNALNDDIANRARNTDVKVALKAQSHLYRAMDVLRDKAEAEGQSGVSRMVEKVPGPIRTFVRRYTLPLAVAAAGGYEARSGVTKGVKAVGKFLTGK